MSTEYFSKDALHHIIQGNLDILSQCVKDTVPHQWTCIIMLMQFIEYLLKYKIQGYGNGICKTHDLKVLYDLLTDDDRSFIEAHFTKIMAGGKPRDPESFATIKEFVERYRNAYTFWRYPVFEENTISDEKYFYVGDTFMVLIALMECSDVDFNLSSAYRVLSTRIQLQKVLKEGVTH